MPGTITDGSQAGWDRPGACGDRPWARGPAPTVASLSLPEVVHRFKTQTTKRDIEGVKQSNWPPFDKRVWQRNYYEHIIRDQDSLARIRRYILNNPEEWPTDPENQSVARFGRSSRGRNEDPWV